MSHEPTSTSNLNADGEQEGSNEGTKTEAQIRAEVETELKAAFTKQLEGSEAYKGLQRAFAKSDTQHRQELASKEQELAALRGQTSEMAEGLDYLSKKFIDGLSPEDRVVALEELRARQVKGLEKQIGQLRDVVTQPRQSTQPQNSPEFEEQMKAILADARDSLEDTVRSHDLDPKDKGLNYGDETEPFAARLRTLNASIKTVTKAKEEADVESVRQRSATPTRTTSGGVPTDTTGKGLFDLGMDEVWARMQQESKTGKRKR